MLVQNYSFMKSPAYMQQALDEITNANRLEVILEALLMVSLYTLLTVGSMFLMRKLIISSSRKIEHALRARLYHKLLALDMEFFQKNETGDLVSRCTNDLNEVRLLLGPGIMYVPNSLSRFILFVPVLLSLSRSLMLVVTVLLVVVIVLIVGLMPRLRPLFKKIQEAVGQINSRVWQVVSGINTVKLYTLEPVEIERFKQLNQQYINRHMAVVKFRGVLWPLFIFLFSLTEFVILLIGGQQVIRQEMTIGQLLQFNVMITNLTFPVLSLGWVMSLIQQGISAMGRINAVLDYPVEQRDDWQTLETDELVFTVKDLRYRYPQQQSQGTAHGKAGPDREFVLDGLDLTIEPGQVVGITGTIGSGKTTLLNILTGLFKPSPGMVFVNGVDICDIRPESLLEKISVVPQETFLFSRSLAENIALGNNGRVEMDEIRAAGRRAGLERDVETFPNQYDQIVGERGITLSGGQKQRTAIARALRKPSPVLIFDDALSSVDARTEAQILEHLRTLDGFNTLIVVSHRISALRDADVIYVLDQGRLVEQGAHAELLAHSGLYARLAKMQQMEMAMQGAADGSS